jgi:hypothetical protein
MNTVTIDDIKKQHSMLGQMLTSFETSLTLSTHGIFLPEASIEMARGEEYAGMILGKDGMPSHHLILLPGEAADVNWQKAQEFAKEAGGELPTRREQSLLFANLKEHFKEAWYWSSEQHASNSDCAWNQLFGYGYQYYFHKNLELRARAVRRLVIE